MLHARLLEGLVLAKDFAACPKKLDKVKTQFEIPDIRAWAKGETWLGEFLASKEGKAWIAKGK